MLASNFVKYVREQVHFLERLCDDIEMGDMNSSAVYGLNLGKLVQYDNADLELVNDFAD